MGANNLEQVLDGAWTEKQLNDWFNTRANEDAYEMGHSYSGGWNMMTGVKVMFRASFSSRDNASEFVLKNARKWEEALAVKFVDTDGKTKWLVGGWAAS